MHVAALTALCLLGSAVPALARSTPHPVGPPSPPTKALHIRLQVEVNDRGQVVAVRHGTLSGDRAVDTMAIGNALQAFIRTSDGRSVPGLYLLSYDYNPKTKKISRVPKLIKPENTWARDPGAVTVMVTELKREAAIVRKRIAAEQAKRKAEEERHLPNINAAIRRSREKQKPSPRKTPH